MADRDDVQRTSTTSAIAQQYQRPNKIADDCLLSLHKCYRPYSTIYASLLYTAYIWTAQRSDANWLSRLRSSLKYYYSSVPSLHCEKCQKCRVNVPLAAVQVDPPKGRGQRRTASAVRIWRLGGLGVPAVGVSWPRNLEVKFCGYNYKPKKTRGRKIRMAQ